PGSADGGLRGVRFVSEMGRGERKKGRGRGDESTLTPFADPKCRRQDLNLHGIAPASPSSWCVCQFRHSGRELLQGNYCGRPGHFKGKGRIRGHSRRNSATASAVAPGCVYCG